MIRLILVILLFASQALAVGPAFLGSMTQGTPPASGCSPASDNNNITLMQRFQDLDSSAGRGTTDWAANADMDNGTLMSAAVIHADADLGANGVNGLKILGAYDYLKYDGTVTDVWDGGNIRYAFLFWIDTLPSASNYPRLFSFKEDGDKEFYGVLRPGGEANIFWEDNVGGLESCQTVGTMSIDTTYVIEAISIVGTGIYLNIYDYTTGALITNGSCSDVAGSFEDIGTPAYLGFGNEGNYDGIFFIDLPIISTDTGTPLIGYRDDTAYNSCN